MSQTQNPNQSEEQPTHQQQSLGDVQIQGDDNIFNVIQAQVVTLTQTEIIQISVDAIKTHELITASPYRGLKKFELEDTNRFFGRDQFIGGLVNELEHTSFILLLGASGSGKSSVVRAGLIPWLQQKRGKHFVSLTFTPDRDPFESLYGSLLSRGYAQAQAQVAKAGKAETLSQVVKTLKPPESFWLIFIDQFEELFTVSEDEKRDRFIDSLIKLSQTSLTSVKIVATMRADFLDRLSPYPRLVKVTDRHRPLIAEMQMDELRLAIEQPAAHHGVVLETGLVEEIISAVQGQAGCLPLLQYTLDLLWETEVQDGGIHDRTLNISSYRQLGGVRGALQQRVDQIYGALSPSEQLAAQRIFLKLVEIGGNGEPGTEWKPVRRRALRSEFTDQQEQTVLMQLIDQNLLVSDAIVQTDGIAPVSTVEITHEILLTSWGRLHDWIQSNRQSIALRNRLNDDVSLWQAQKADSDLWSGSKLAQVVELRRDPVFQKVLGGLSDPANQFIDASVGLRERQQRRVVLGLSGFSIAALTLASFALYQLQQAERQRVEQLAATAEALLATQPVEAEVNAIAAVALSQSWFVQFPNHPRFIAAENSLLNTQRENLERNRLLHEAPVNSVALSPDGSTIVSGCSDDNTLWLWDAQTGVLKHKLVGHKAQVNSVAFSPDGKTIVSGSDDNTVLLWDVLSGTPKGKPLAGHQARVSSVAFSPDGKTIVSGSWDKTVRLWDAQAGALKGKPLISHTSGSNSVAFSPDGKTIVSGGRDHTVQMWDVQTRTRKGKPFIGHEGAVTSVAFSPDGKTIVSGSVDNTIRLWDVQTRTLRDNPLIGHGAGVTSVVFSPNGKTIVSSGGDNTIRLWDVQTRTPKDKLLIGHEGAVSSVAFSHDGETIVSGSRDKTVRLWNMSKNKQLIGHEDVVSSVALSPDGKIIVSGSWDGTLRLWDAQTGLLKGKPLDGHNAQVHSVAFSPDGKTIASGGSDNMVRLWDAQTGASKGEPLMGHTDTILSVAFSPNGKTIASGSMDNTVRLWNAQTGASKGKPLMGHTDMVFSVAFSPDNKTIVSGSMDRTIRLWDAQTGASKGKPLTGHRSDVHSVAFSPDGKTIVSGSDDSTLRLWDAQTGVLKGEPLIGHGSGVSSVAFSPDGKTIASGSVDRTIRLWEAQTGLPRGNPLIGHKVKVFSIAFSPDGKTLISGSMDGTIRLWDDSSGNLQIACNQLQNHSILLHSTSESIKQAQTTCQKLVWLK